MMNSKMKFSFREILLLVLLSFFSVSLFNMAGYFLAGAFLLCLLLYINSEIVVNKTILVLFFFSLFYFLNYAMHFPFGVKEVIIYLFAPLGCYLIGEAIIRHSKQKNMFFWLSIVLIGGLFLHGLLNLIMTLMYEDPNSTYRITYDFWRKEPIAVTGCSLYYVPLVALCIGYLFYGNKKIGKFLSFIAICLGLFANLIYQNRTILYLIAILLCLVVFISFFRKRIKIKSICLLVLVLLCFFFIWTYDLMGLKTTILNLDITERINSDEVGRVAVWMSYLSSDWWRYPFGGNQAEFGYNYAHNLWLDTLDTVGFLPFILLFIFSIQGFMILIDFYKQNKEERKIYLFMILAIVISSAVEPVIQANPYYFLTLIVLLGGMDGQLHRKDVLKHENCTHSS